MGSSSSKNSSSSSSTTTTATTNNNSNNNVKNSLINGGNNNMTQNKFAKKQERGKPVALAPTTQLPYASWQENKKQPDSLSHQQDYPALEEEAKSYPTTFLNFSKGEGLYLLQVCKKSDAFSYVVIRNSMTGEVIKELFTGKEEYLLKQENNNNDDDNSEEEEEKEKKKKTTFAPGFLDPDSALNNFCVPSKAIDWSSDGKYLFLAAQNNIIRGAPARVAILVFTTENDSFTLARNPIVLENLAASTNVFYYFHLAVNPFRKYEFCVCVPNEFVVWSPSSENSSDGDEEQFLTTPTGHVNLLNIEEIQQHLADTGTMSKHVSFFGCPRSVEYSPVDPNIIAVAGSGNMFMLFDTQKEGKSQLIRVLGLALGGVAVNRMQFFRDGSGVVLCSGNMLLCVFDLRQAAASGELHVEKPTIQFSTGTTPNDVCLHPRDDTVCIVACNDSRLRAYSTTQERSIGFPLVAHCCPVLSIAYHPKAYIVASGDQAGSSIKVWTSEWCWLARKRVFWISQMSRTRIKAAFEIWTVLASVCLYLPAGEISC